MSEEERIDLDINDIEEFSDMRLHVKNLQEDLWDFIGSVRSFKEKIKNKENEVKRLKTVSKTNSVLILCLFLFIIKKN